MTSEPVCLDGRREDDDVLPCERWEECSFYVREKCPLAYWCYRTDHQILHYFKELDEEAGS